MSRFGISSRILPVGLALAACQSVIGANFDDVAPKAKSDAGGDGKAACDLARPPDPTVLGPTGGNIELYLLAKNTRFGEETTNKGTTPPSFGFDLDQTCTSGGDAPLCLPPAYTKGDPTDGPHGEDNSVAKMVGGEYAELHLDPPAVSSASISAGVVAGKFAPFALIHVTSFAAYDGSVNAEWIVPLAAKYSPDGAFVPKLDGSDAWPVLAASAADAGPADQPLRFQAKQAYLVGHRLVAYFDEARVPLVNSYFAVHDVVLEGHFDPSGQSWVLNDAVVGGWARAKDMLAIVPGFTAELFQIPLCTNLAVYGQQIKPWLCSKLDLLKDAPEGSPCDAYSIGVGFDTVPVTLGKVGPAPATATCPAASDPANDDCNTPPVIGDGGNPFDAGK